MRTTMYAVLGLLLVAVVAPGSVGVAHAQPAGGCTFPVTETDDTGTEVTIETEPERIVTLAPSAAQTMWEIGGRDKVVGLTKYALYLDGAENRTDVTGDPISIETVVSLNPDLVLAPGIIPDDTIESLRSAGQTVFRFEDATSIQSVVEKTELTGRLTGECAGARETADEMRHDVAVVREAVAGVDRPRVLYSFFGFTVGSGTFIHDILETAGGRNIVAAAGESGYVQLNEEIVVERNPEWIVLNSDDPEVPDSPAYNGTDAVQNDNVVVVDASYISQPAPRVVQPLMKLTRAFHPDAYDRAVDELSESSSGPSFAVRADRLNRSVVRVGEPVSFGAEVSNDGATGTYGAMLFVNDTAKRSKDFQIEAGTTESIAVRWTFDSPGVYAVSINDHRLGTVRAVASTPTATDATTATAHRTTLGSPSPTVTPSPSPSPTATEAPARTATPRAGEAGTETTTPVAASTGAATEVVTDRGTTGASEPATTAAGGSSTTGPGFGMAAAAIALLATAVLWIRRSPAR